MAESVDGALQETPIPASLPGLLLAPTVVFPYDVVSMQINRPRSLRLLAAHEGDSQVVACFFPRDAEGEPDESDEWMLDVGVAARIIHRIRLPNDTMQVVLQGIRRVKRTAIEQTDPYLRVAVEPLATKEARGPDVDGLIYRCMEMVGELIRSDGGYPQEMVEILRMNIAGGGRFADLVGSHLNFPLPVKRRIASTANVRDRLRIVEEVLQESLQRQKVESDVSHRVRTEIDARQREALLRAQMRAIRKELGEEADASKEAEDLRERLRSLGLPPEADAAAAREIDRLAGMSAASPEYQVARTYVSWILDLPWNAVGRERIDLVRAAKTLDRDHHGLEDVKQRILEFLAVRRLKKDPKGPILCLVGPPGVGKTSLGRSIAEAVKRTFVRVSVGGMRDEAEIKGHRRTYVGAMPGKVLQSLKRAGTRDPVFMIDEIDKMGSDASRGDPASAMLEVLDPEQNASFQDHYLDLPFDLSRVFFIATANLLDGIPGPLRDRMEVIALSGYTREEKFHIAARHLVPKVLADTGLTAAQVEFVPEGLRALIDGHTREAGVRNLERLLGSVCRRVALRVARGDRTKVVVDATSLETLLDRAPFWDESAAREPAVGVATGLAWTEGGGIVMFVETLSMPGSGRILMTGRLGEVMRESAELAYSWVKSRAADFGIDPDVFRGRDVHVHVPEGAVPKDGPSAGVTLVTALVSLFTDKPVRTDLAMTGEVTLKGRVLPVGGIKEKVLAARRAGIRHVLLPEGNRRDLKEVPEEVRGELDVEFSASVRENVERALLSVVLPDVPRRAPLRAAPRASGPPPPHPSGPRPGSSPLSAP